MFFANMFCYGSDTTDVRITGIRGCMGGFGPVTCDAVHLTA